MKTEKEALLGIVDDFLGRYFNRYFNKDLNIGFSEWFPTLLREKMPELTVDASEKLGGEIIAAVAQYDRTLGELNQAVNDGQGMDGWLADKVMENLGNTSLDDAGAKMLRLLSDLNIANAKFMREQELDNASDTKLDDDAMGMGGYTEDGLRSMVLDIAGQSSTFGGAVMYGVVKDYSGNNGAADIGKALEQALPVGRDAMRSAAKTEVKAVIAGALKTAAMKSMVPNILSPEKTTEFIGGLAGTAAETADTLYDVAAGNTTPEEGAERVGRAFVAFICRFIAEILRGLLGWVECIPYIGAAFRWLTEHLIKHMECPKFADDVFNKIREFLQRIWNWIKQKWQEFIEWIMGRRKKKTEEAEKIEQTEDNTIK
jgi:hypothetical protein